MSPTQNESKSSGNTTGLYTVQTAKARVVHGAKLNIITATNLNDSSESI
jgi:hypothetical protein